MNKDKDRIRLECVGTIMAAEFHWNTTKEGKRYLASIKRRTMIRRIMNSPEGRRILAEKVGELP